MAHEVLLRQHEFFERRIDRIEIDVGDEAVDAGIDTSRPLSVHVTAGRNELGERFQIGEAARVSRLRSVAADALKVVALKIELARFLQAFRCRLGCSRISASRNAGQ